MNKREQARKERMDFVISHSHVGDLRSAIDFLKSQENASNGLYELNIRYAMSCVNVECLCALGWREIPCAGNGNHIWELPCSKTESVYLSLSTGKRWQFLGDNAQFLQCDWFSLTTEKRMRFLETNLLSAIEVLPPQSMAEEEIMLRQICPKLTTARGKVIDISKEDIDDIWERMVHYWRAKDDNTGIALIFSMLRHQEEWPDKIWIAPFLTTFAGAYSVAVWGAFGCRTMLEYTPDGCICTLYSWPANLLSDMGCHLAAFYCINIFWLYTPQQPWYAKESYLEYAQAAIAEILDQGKTDSLQAVLDAVDFYIAIRKDVFKEECDTISYLKGLVAARNSDFTTAAQMFELAYQHLPANSEYGDVDLHIDMRLQLQQCMKAVADCLKKRRGFTRHQRMFERSLEYFPHVPWYHIMKGEELPAGMEYPGHGEHLGALLGRPVQQKDIESFASMLKRQGISDAEASFEVIRGNGKISAYIYPLSLPSKNNEVQILALVKNEDIKSFAQSASAYELLGFFPAVNSSFTNLLRHSVSRLSYDPQHMECLFSLELPLGDVEFYMIPAYMSYYYSALKCNIALSAIGYHLQPLVPTTLPATDLEGNAIELHIDHSLRVLTRSACGGRDDVEFVAQIKKAKKIKFLDTSLWMLTLSFDERAYNLELPMLVNCANVKEGYIPRKGDVVNGVAWLQGRLDDSEADWDD